MRLKTPLSENDRRFTCCFCCHVRVGTTILGTFYVLIHLIALGLTAVTLASANGPESLQDRLQTFTIDQNENSTSYYSWDQMNSRDGCVVFVLLFITFLFSVMMVHGSVRSRPGLLLPFFCMLVFDFFIHCLTVVRYMTYAPNIKLWLVEQGLANNPSCKPLMEMDEQWLQLWFVIFFVLVLSVKAYLINMVWMCYKYLQLRNYNRSVVRQYTIDPDTEQLLPPKYEDAIKMEVPTGPPPPPYSA